MAQAMAALFEARERAFFVARDITGAAGAVRERGMYVEYFAHVNCIGFPIRCEPQFAAWLQNAREQISKSSLDDPALMLTLLWPGIGKKYVHSVDRCDGNLIALHVDGIVHGDAHVAK